MAKALPRVSSAGQWIHCPASFQAQKKHPALDPTPSDAVLEGRLLHSMLEKALDGEVIEANEYVEEAYQIVSQYDNLVVEERIDLDMIYSGFYGKCDAYAVSEDGSLDVFDFKFGHSYVAVEENPQLVLYAIGIVSKLVIGTGEVRLHIIQPKCYTAPTHRTWVTSVGELLNYVILYRRHILAALDPNPIAHTGSWCKYCTARAYCKPLRDNVTDCVDYVSGLNITDVTNDQIAIDLKILEAVTERVKHLTDALKEQAMFKLKNGEAVHGWGLVNKKGRAKFANGVEPHIRGLGELFGVKVVEEKLLTPNQIIKNGLDSAVMNDYIITPSSVEIAQMTTTDYENLFKEDN